MQGLAWSLIAAPIDVPVITAALRLAVIKGHETIVRLAIRPLLIVRVDARADDVGPLPGVDATAQMREHARHERGVGLGDDEGGHRFAASGQFGEPGDVEIPEPCHGRRARDRRGRHDQQMRYALAPVQQRLSLLDAEPVLFVDDHEGELGRLEACGERRVGGDDDAGLAAGDLGQRRTPGRQAHAPGDRGDRNRYVRLLLQRLDHRADGMPVLFGQHLGGSHEHSLMPRSDGQHHGRERDHGLARTDLTLQQPAHRMTLPHIRGNGVDHLTLARRQGERQRCDESVAQVLFLALVREQPP